MPLTLAAALVPSPGTTAILDPKQEIWRERSHVCFRRHQADAERQRRACPEDKRAVAQLRFGLEVEAADILLGEVYDAPGRISEPAMTWSSIGPHHVQRSGADHRDRVALAATRTVRKGELSKNRSVVDL
jgi:hypothetical protein